tara:strand:+ start:10568 stop:10756 length:189 start_codon:yes stop_codon:yes gene_type:complete
MEQDVFTRVVMRSEELENRPRHNSFNDYLGSWVSNTGAENKKLNDVEDLISVIDTILNQIED